MEVRNLCLIYNLRLQLSPHHLWRSYVSFSFIPSSDLLFQTSSISLNFPILQSIALLSTAVLAAFLYKEEGKPPNPQPGLLCIVSTSSLPRPISSPFSETFLLLTPYHQHLNVSLGALSRTDWLLLLKPHKFQSQMVKKSTILVSHNYLNHLSSFCSQISLLFPSSCLIITFFHSLKTCTLGLLFHSLTAESQRVYTMQQECFSSP